jgi:predicted enzyme related to lactoylglutathione lyase
MQEPISSPLGWDVGQLEGAIAMTHRGLTGAVLYAKDLPRLTDFYAAVACLDVQSVQKGFAVLGRAPSQLVIVQIPKRIADSIDISTPPERREDTPVKLVFTVEDIAGVRTRAAERGGAMNAAGREWEFEGARVCDGHDPEGNVFQVRQAD